MLGRWADAGDAQPIGNELVLTPPGVVSSGLGAATNPRNHCLAAATFDFAAGAPLLVFANGICVSGDPATTSELGHTALLGVRLCTQPSANVVVDVASDDPTEGTVSPGQLVFTTTSWADEQEVTVTPVDDGQVDGAMTYLVTLTVDDAASPDDYDGIIDAAIVTNLDVDVIFFDGFESGDTSAWSSTVP